MSGHIPAGACSCPYNWGPACKHQVAAWLALAPMITEPPKLLSMLDSTVKLPVVDDMHLQLLVTEADWKLRNSIKLITLKGSEGQSAELTVSYKKESFTVRLSQVNADTIHTSCTCNVEQYQPLCAHKLVALQFLRNTYGKRPLIAINRDWTSDKNKLLAEYGFSMNDNLKGKFDFKVDTSDELSLVILDPSIQKVNQNWELLGKRFKLPETGHKLPVSQPDSRTQPILLYALRPSPAGSIPGLEITPAFANESPKTLKLTSVKEVRYGGFDRMPAITEAQSELITLSGKFNSSTLNSELSKKNLLSGYYYTSGHVMMTAEATEYARQWEAGFMQVMHPLLAVSRLFLAKESHYLSASNLEPVQLAPEPVHPHLTLREKDGMTVLEVHFILDGQKIIPDKQNRPAGPWFIRRQSTLYRIARASDVILVDQLAANGSMRVRSAYVDAFFRDFIVPLTEQFDIEIKLERPMTDLPLFFQDMRIFLKEDEEHILFVPEFTYQLPDAGHTTANEQPENLYFSNDGRQTRLTYHDNHIQVLHRDPAAEANRLNLFIDQHADFTTQKHQSQLALPFSKLLENNCFLNFFEAMKQADIPVLGVNDLKKFRYNPNRAVVQIRAGSGIDWFDLSMTMQFGDQFASLSDIRKAIVNRQNYVQLSDGTLGLLPEDWLNKYGQVLKVGQVNGDDIRLSKLHFAIIDALSEQIDNAAVLAEIAEKKHKLLNFKQIKDVQMPPNLNATLRDYQVEGYKWLNFLDEFGWGGILADDMGLGKTLQILAFIRMIKNRTPDATVLVVVPTSLIFNWQAEVDKFCPELRVLVQRGLGRATSADTFAAYDIILCSYGTVRSDIEWLRNFRFDYVILDESQAIKNPTAQVTKAVKLLQASNRLVMTGTPVENNTFDLYSQMDFLNPGLLGTQEFFRTEYATPIDKHQDADRAADLRQLIRPFMLKRTKEEVAKDLPEKTETVLFCEMGKKQRKVYETMREHYRQRITTEMAAVGREKAAFLILEGLLKLRQICDSPALLSDGADYGQESAKLDELVREIEENASNHKIIIFSQFLKMLDLVKHHLEKHKITYEYLDGQTTDRASRVNRFQTDQDCRVFLMSLKAGGVGLNLTEADYVYLVDPWWNPAVEQQAIDRAHRIGQTRAVFAYRMICKDTVEEKIMQLQDRKRDLAADLISTEAGFIKKLSQDDIVGLFS